MNLKIKMIFITILIGVISCFGFSIVEASEITSVFSGETITRDTVGVLATVSETNTTKTLGITSSRYKTNNGEVYWEIIDKDGNYADLYCLNIARGFGAPDGSIYESGTTLIDGNGEKVTYNAYNKQLDLNTIGIEDYQNYTGLTTVNKNKILWILNNSLTSTEDLKTILTVASDKVEEAGWTSYVKEDMKKNNDTRTSLTFEDIKMVQQIAIWQYTNPENENTEEIENIFYNTITGICDSEGNQISNQGENILINTDTYYNYVRSGLIKQAKINALYRYFIDGAESASSITTIPTLILDNTKTTVAELGEEYYIVGPFSLNGTNTSLIKEITATVNKNYTLLNSLKNPVPNNDFANVVGNKFYLKITKSEIKETTQINIGLTYKYDVKKLILLTNSNPTDTQPVVLIDSEEKDPSISTDAEIKLAYVGVVKNWRDNYNQDGKRPENIKVQLFVDGVKKGEPVTLTQANVFEEDSNQWIYNWELLLAGKKYTVKELDKYGNILEAEGKLDENYKVAEYEYYYMKEGVQVPEGKTPEMHINGIINSYIPETINITGTKTWEDNNNQDGKRPNSITINLLANGKEVSEVVLNTDSNSSFKFTDLPKYENGKEIEYTITENAVPGYVSIKDGYNITNKYTTEKLEKTVTKIWEDNNNQDGKRSEYGVTLKANGNVYAEEVRLDKDTLTYTWRDLPKYENGEEIIYTVEETTIPEEYNAIYSEDTFTIKNVYTPGKVSKRVVKEWKDENDQDRIRPNHVIVKLYKTIDNEKTLIDTKRLDETNDWMHTWSELDKKEDGKEIIYSVEENSVDKYTTTYSAKDYSDTDEITITNTHIPVEITGKYNVILRKVDENGNILEGSKFKVSGTEYDLATGEIIIYENQQITKLEDIELTYIIEEILAPEGYNVIDRTEVNIKSQVQKVDNNYKLIRATLVDSEGNNITDEKISIKLEGQSIVIEVKNTPIEKQFDLALRKFITAVNDIEYSREPVVDTSKLGTIVDGKTVTTAIYKHAKQPIAVQKGDVVTYTIRVYNEGDLDGYVDRITDHLPKNLLPIIDGVEGINSEKYSEEIEFNSNWLWLCLDKGNTVTTTITSKSNSDSGTYSVLTGLEEITDTKLDAYVEGADKLDYIDVQIKCLVTDDAVSGEYLTNIAEITESQDINEVEGDGADSILGNADHSNLSDYRNNEAINSTVESYIAGQEDDDDFEKLVVKEFDLSLRKFIVKVNETNYSREPVVDTSKLGTTVDGKTITTATYNHSKEPVIVKTNDIVTYTIRVYNEGTLAGFANEITDDIPEGLEFLSNSDINVLYKWKMLDSEGKETTDSAKAEMIITDYLSDSSKTNIIEARREAEGVKTLNYKDVQVQFKVVAEPKNLEDNIIINEAQISADSDGDIDSAPNRDEKYNYTTGNNEDDIDYEPIKLQYFDLALRKFVTKVNSVDYNNRYPEIKYNEDGSITYSHTKDPVLVTTGDTVIYTIRVYNEGEIVGYATEIKDNLPEGLAFDPNDDINRTYEWKMLDSEGNVTEEAEKVVAFKTNYLENEKIEALVETNGSRILSYKDVQIAFKVTESNLSDRILVNTAQISADSDDDIDSIPDNNIETEDDTDKEYIRVEYFDLAIKKWVTATKVTLDGKTTTTKTNYGEDSEAIAKVDIVASKLKKTTVKFVYNIKVTNEGELPGYAYEVKDYIPTGLKFVAEDNKDWKEAEDGTVVTDKLKDTLLNPGESATVEIVLTWKNSSTNLGIKTNYAEISNDSADDIDSIPDNYDFTEDDIDDAQVILSIKTAGATTYIGLILITVAILAGGVFSIKKYVLD